MGKFCTGCGESLKKDAKFCTKCGASVVLSMEEIKPDETKSDEDNLVEAKSAVTPEPAVLKSIAGSYAKKLLKGETPAYKAAGELALPMELTPDMGAFGGEKLLSIIKSGFSSLIKGFKRTFINKKLLVLVIVVSLIWLFLNVLTALGIFPLPLRLLSWLTAAGGSMIGGSVGKGLVAAMMAQLLTDKHMLKRVKGGFGQLTSLLKGRNKAYSSLLMGAGASLIVSNMMFASNLQNTMVCIAGFALSAKALMGNGFLRRLTSSLMPKASNAGISSIMGGWTAGFALFILVSLIPGVYNGYIIGVALFIGGIILMILNNKKKEVAL